MAEHNPHIIARHVLELAVPSVALASEVQEAAAHCLRARAMTAIESLFDRFGGPGQVLRLERLEIDLGHLAGNDWQQQFETRLIAQLTESLRQVTVNKPTHSSQSESGQGTAFEQLLYFLRHGRLPWWGDSPPANWPHQLLQTLEPSQWQALAATLVRNEHAQRRVIHALADEALSSLLSRHAGLHAVQRLFTLWCPANQSPAQQQTWRTQFWLAVLDTVTATDAPERGVTIMKRLLRLRPGFAAPPPPFAAPPGAAQIMPSLPSPWQEWLAAAWQVSKTPDAKAPDVPSRTQDTRSIAATTNSAHDEAGAPQRAPIQNQGSSIHNGLPFTFSTNHKEPSDSDHSGEIIPLRTRTDTPAARGNNHPAQLDEVIYLNGAGCIILHPFLEELFRSNGLLEKRRFPDDAARERAVRLLGHLTFGDRTAPEYELLLPKLLCGMPWEHTLAPGEITAEERTTCDELLYAVLKHWRALKSNSTEWLREQFFLRAAKLEQLNGDWRLTIERRAQDVLLDQLPWGLGVVDLPWWQGLIYVHWMK